MSPPAELSFDEILKFMLAHNGKVTNHELVKHFKVFLMNPNMRDEARSTFKKHVNSLAIIKNQNNEKWLILKKKYMVNSEKENDEQTADTKIETPPAPECSESSPDPPVQPPYRPPPPLQLNQDFNILNNIIQDSTPITTPLSPVELTQSASKESLESEDVPPKVHPRRRSSEKSATPNIPSHNLNPRSSIPNSTIELNDTPLTTSRSESMLVESEQKISVKERKQMFNRMASESDVLKSQKLSFNSSGNSLAPSIFTNSEVTGGSGRSLLFSSSFGPPKNIALNCAFNINARRTQLSFALASRHLRSSQHTSPLQSSQYASPHSFGGYTLAEKHLFSSPPQTSPLWWSPGLIL